MNKSINLHIPNEENNSLKKRLDLLRIISLCILLGIVSLSVTLFFLILTSPLPALRMQETTAERKLLELRTTSGQLFLIKERLGEISKILARRPKFDQIISKVDALLPGGITIERIQVDETTMAFTVSSTSLQQIDSFIQLIEDLKTTDKLFSGVTLTQLRLDQENPKYIVTLTSEL